MKTQLTWTGNMKFSSEASGNKVDMDAKPPIGQGTAMTPKELVAAGLGGCSAMDVIALFKKHKQTPESFKIDVEVDMSQGSYPQVFTKASISYEATGKISRDVFIEAVTLSQTKYCGVSAMLVKSFPIFYRVVLNGEVLKEGQAQFGGRQ